MSHFYFHLELKSLSLRNPDCDYSFHFYMLKCAYLVSNGINRTLLITSIILSLRWLCLDFSYHVMSWPCPMAMTIPWNKQRNILWQEGVLESVTWVGLPVSMDTFMACVYTIVEQPGHSIKVQSLAFPQLNVSKWQSYSDPCWPECWLNVKNIEFMATTLIWWDIGLRSLFAITCSNLLFNIIT